LLIDSSKKSSDFGLDYSKKFSADISIVINPISQALRPFSWGQCVIYHPRNAQPRELVLLGLPDDSASGGVFGVSAIADGKEIVIDLKSCEFAYCIPVYVDNGAIKYSSISRKDCFDAVENFGAKLALAGKMFNIDISDDETPGAVDTPIALRKNRRASRVFPPILPILKDPCLLNGKGKGKSTAGKGKGGKKDDPPKDPLDDKGGKKDDPPPKDPPNPKGGKKDDPPPKENPIPKGLKKHDPPPKDPLIPNGAKNDDLSQLNVADLRTEDLDSNPELRRKVPLISDFISYNMYL
jgi:hypothetical protein